MYQKNVHETTAYLRVGASLLNILLCVMLKYHARRSGLGASISRSRSAAVMAKPLVRRFPRKGALAEACDHDGELRTALEEQCSAAMAAPTRRKLGIYAMTALRDDDGIAASACGTDEILATVDDIIGRVGQHCARTTDD